MIIEMFEFVLISKTKGKKIMDKKLVIYIKTTRNILKDQIYPINITEKW